MTQSAASVAKAKWESNMLYYGGQLAAKLAATKDVTPVDTPLGQCFYDAAHVFYSIAKYTGNPQWKAAAANAVYIYRDRYVVPNNWATSGYWLFTKGLKEDFYETGNEASRTAVINLSLNSSYASDSTNPAWTFPAAASREVAYNLLAEIDAEHLGHVHRARTDLLTTQALGHIEQWLAFGSAGTPAIPAAPYVRPFMVGITCNALIAAFEAFGDPRIPPAIQKALDWIWSECWVPAAKAFKYTNIVAPDGTGADNPTADLNLLIVNSFSWVARQLGDLTAGGKLYYSRADEIFVGGVNGAFLGAGKQFNQNYRQSFDYVALRPEL